MTNHEADKQSHTSYYATKAEAAKAYDELIKIMKASDEIMSDQSNYPCPICGADNMCTDFTDVFKWGRAYCNSCDCGGPEVRAGYDKNLDALWRVEARKQFVEVVNEYVSKRCLEWVETTERLPVKEDAGIDDMVAFCYRDEWNCFNRLEKWDEINPQKHTYWHKMLKAPEVQE